MLTDTHTHLHFDQYKSDLTEVIQRAHEAGVKRILTLGTQLESGIQALKIANTNDIIYAAVGIHPTEVNKSNPGDTHEIVKLAQNEEKIIAIGEIGLDLYWKEVPLKSQLRVFEKMLETADELSLPVVIHNRDAQKEMRHFFEEMNITSLKGVMHSFSGDEEDVQFYLEKGLHISFTGVITFKNFIQESVVRSVPVNRLLLETDCPFLTPVPYRGKRNEPAYVRYIAEKLAHLHEKQFAEICRITADNSAKLFRWTIPQ